MAGENKNNTMPLFLDSVESSFGSRDLYEVLVVDSKASEAEVRRAYHRLSLRVHPDRVEAAEVDQATIKFQVKIIFRLN